MNYQQTSQDAYESIKRHAPTIKDAVLAVICRSGGATCDEVEEALQLRHQTASARVRELAKDGLIRDTGVRMSTRSGRRAIVWGTTLW